MLFLLISLPLAADAQITPSFSLPQANTIPVLPALVGTTEHIGVQLNTVDDRPLLAYEFSFTYDPSVIHIAGVSTTGTLSKNMLIVANTQVPGRLSVAASGTDPISDAGTLVELEVDYIGGGQTALTWDHFTINEDDASNITFSDSETEVAGEILINEIWRGDDEDGWIELLVIADGLDLRGYRIGGLDNDSGVIFSDDPLWNNLAAGTVILLGNSGATFQADFNPADFHLAVRAETGLGISLFNGSLSLGQSIGPAILRPDHTVSFTLLQGPFELGQGLHFVELSIQPNTGQAFLGQNGPAIRAIDQWRLLSADEVSPGVGNNPANAAWIDALRLSSANLLSLPHRLDGLSGNHGSWPVYIGNLDDVDLFAYSFVLEYDPSLIRINKVNKVGTLSANTQLVANTGIPGRLRVAASQIEPFSGQGPLLNIDITYLDRGQTNVSFAEVVLNEGLPVRPVNSLVTSRVGFPDGLAVELPQAKGGLGEISALPITVADLNGHDVFSYAFTLVYDPVLARITGVSQNGTLSANMLLEANSQTPGRLTVAASQVQPLTAAVPC